ncbi:MAG TPA: hypothetical protein VFR81_13620 [Longimicrobium sp.]|nr:hypothetical protein [Longimicrobium sp.]
MTIRKSAHLLAAGLAALAAAAAARPVAAQDALPPGVMADVVVFPTMTSSTWRGALEVTEWGDGRVVGRLAGGGDSVRILFRLPYGTSRLAGAGGRSTLSLVEPEWGRPRREVTLRDEGGRLLLYILSDASDRPYRRDVADLGLSVRQVEAGEPGRSPVEVALGGQRFVLRPGEVRRTRDAGGPLEIFLAATYFGEPGRTVSAGADPYQVLLMVFRRDGR